jgi:membrane-associated phospholipid phosphatase
MERNVRGTTLERAPGGLPAAGVADAIEGGVERRAMDRLFGLYLLVSGAALAFPAHPPGWAWLVLLHVLGAAFALGVPPFDNLAARMAARAPRVTSFFHDWYPLATMPLLYKELATLNVEVWGGRYFDSVIQAADQAIFGTQPSVALSRALPYLAISEPLHAAYLSYYAIIYGPPLALYLLGRRGDFRRLVFPLMLTFFVHYLFFVYFPVSGPRYLFPPPGGELARGPVYQLAHHLLQGGSSRGAAFPSSHVAVSTAMTILVFRFLPRVGPLVALGAAGLAFGAVYAGFHYATDVMVGLLAGILIVVLAAPAVGRVLGGRRGER